MKTLIGLLPSRLQWRLWAALYSVRYGPVSNCINAIWALKLARLFLTGRLIVIDSQDSVSNGGYRYKTITFSKIPISSMHTYKGF